MRRPGLDMLIPSSISRAVSISMVTYSMGIGHHLSLVTACQELLPMCREIERVLLCEYRRVDCVEVWQQESVDKI